MYLFFDGVSSYGYIGLYDLQKHIIDSENFEIVGNESTQTIPLIENFLKKNAVKYNDIQNIVVVVGPGSFTGIRTISLVVNTLSYIYPHIFLTPVSFFDLYSDYPIVKSSSKRDLFVKRNKSATIEVVQNDNISFSKEVKIVYGDTDISRLSEGYQLNNTIDYEENFRRQELQNEKRISPLYIKKPNIS